MWIKTSVKKMKWKISRYRPNISFAFKSNRERETHCTCKRLPLCFLPCVCEKGPAIFTSLFSWWRGEELKLSLSFLSSSLSSPLPHLPPGAARWGLIRGKVKWAAHLCELPMPLPLSGAYLGPFVWARHPVPHFTSPFQTFPFHVIPSLVPFPLLGHLLHIPTQAAPPSDPSLSIPFSLLLWHIPAPLEEEEEVENLSRTERERESEIKNMRERKERREEGGRRASSLWECLLPAALWGETQQDYSLRPQLKPDLWKLSLRVRYLAQLGSHSSLAHPLIHAFFHEVLRPPLSFFSARSKSVLILHPSGFFPR